MYPIKILIKRDTYENLKEFIPQEEELVTEYSNNHKHTWFKIGDGKTPYKNLPYIHSLKEVPRFKVYIEEKVVAEIYFNAFMITEFLNKNNFTCKDCKYFLGMGDWNLCCSKKYDLCYEDTPSCEEFTSKLKKE